MHLPCYLPTHKRKNTREQETLVFPLVSLTFLSNPSGSLPSTLWGMVLPLLVVDQELFSVPITKEEGIHAKALSPIQNLSRELPVVKYRTSVPNPMEEAKDTAAQTNPSFFSKC